MKSIISPEDCTSILRSVQAAALAPMVQTNTADVAKVLSPADHDTVSIVNG